VIPELEKANMIDDHTICYDGQSKILGSSEHLGYIEDVRMDYAGDNTGVCVTFHNKTTKHDHEKCSSRKVPYYIKPSTSCAPKKGGMRRKTQRLRSARRKTQRGLARRRTQRGGLFGWFRKKAEPQLTSDELDKKIALKERIIKELELEMDRNPSKKHTHHVPRQSNVNDIRESQAARLRILKVDLQALYRQRQVAKNEGRYDVRYSAFDPR
jgi:hypothetical protein